MCVRAQQKFLPSARAPKKKEGTEPNCFNDDNAYKICNKTVACALCAVVVDMCAFNEIG